MGQSRFATGRAIGVLSFGLVANLAPLMTFVATLHEIAAGWGLSASQSGWIGDIYFAGYAIAVPALASATDRMDGRRVYVGSALLGAVASLAFALWAHGFWVALILRLLGGIGLAGTHMPGLNLLMDRIEGPQQGRAAAIYTSTYAAGNGRSGLRLPSYVSCRRNRTIVGNQCPHHAPSASILASERRLVRSRLAGAAA
jgi:MFS family permease